MRIIRMAASILKYENPDCRRQIAVLALGIDFAHQLRQVDMTSVRHRPKFVPENIFQGHARLVTADHK